MSDLPQTPSSPKQPSEGHRSIAGAAGLIGAATFSSRILGFIRDIILARLLGASASADAFFVAYRVPGHNGPVEYCTPIANQSSR